MWDDFKAGFSLKMVVDRFTVTMVFGPDYLYPNKNPSHVTSHNLKLFTEWSIQRARFRGLPVQQFLSLLLLLCGVWTA